MGYSVLEPDSRSLLSELLRPPPGFVLSHAVGTTFTLGLDAALAIPLSLAGATAISADDSVGVISAVRRAIDRIDVFAQAGYIRLGGATDLVTVLEPMIHPLVMEKGLFHPKVWFLEFEAGDERRYRFVCSSRNLTNDRTWDAVISLDGKPAMQPNDRRRDLNHSSASLLRWLSQPGRTSPRLSADRSARIARLATSWESVEWERPEHARKMRTHVLGIGVNSAPKSRGTRTLIVSPFVTAEGIQQLRSGENVDTTILSRPEQLDRLSPVTLTELTTFVLDDFVDRELVGGQSDDASNTALSGLHAKVVVRDLTKTKSSLMIGSANATGPAWSANVEVMVEVEGPADRLGVDAIAKSLAPLIEECLSHRSSRSMKRRAETNRARKKSPSALSTPRCVRWHRAGLRSACAVRAPTRSTYGLTPHLKCPPGSTCRGVCSPRAMMCRAPSRPHPRPTSSQGSRSVRSLRSSWQL